MVQKEPLYTSLRVQIWKFSKDEYISQKQMKIKEAILTIKINQKITEKMNIYINHDIEISLLGRFSSHSS